MRFKRRNIIDIVKVYACIVSVAAVSVFSVYKFGNYMTAGAYAFNYGKINTDEHHESTAVLNDDSENITQPDSGSVTEKESDTGTDGSLQTASGLSTAVPEIQQTQENPDAVAVDLSALSGKYKNYGGTSVINNTDYDVDDLLYADYVKPQINKNDPYILIYHTHTSEAYYGGGTVVDVGNIMAQEFEKLGYKVVHLTDVYDKEQFSGAYSRSINGVEKALAENPSIQLTLDIHRDAISTANGTVYRPVTEIDGKTSAQVMPVCGTDAKGLKHPDWRENFKYALDLSRTMNKNYNALSRPVNLRGDRFNTHVTKYALLLEIGSDANTLSEAATAAVYTARSIISVIEKDG